MGKSSGSPGIHTGMKLLAAAEVSRDMAENLLKAFDGSPPGSVLTLEIRDFGLWVVNSPVGSTMFIGSMKPSVPRGKDH